MDEAYLLTAARYIEFNSVRVGLVENPWDYHWSSVSAHLAGKDDALVKAIPLLEIAGNRSFFLSEDISEQGKNDLRQYERNGRPTSMAQ